MKTWISRQQELEGLLRRGGRPASRVIDRYVELCDELLPLNNILAHIVARIMEVETATHLIGSEAGKKSTTSAQQALMVPDGRLRELSPGTDPVRPEEPVVARTVVGSKRRTAGHATAR